MYGDPTQEVGGLPLLREGVIGATSIAQETVEELPEEGVALHSLRLALLDHLTLKIPNLKEVGGVTSIPFFQASHFHNVLSLKDFKLTKRSFDLKF